MIKLLVVPTALTAMVAVAAAAATIKPKIFAPVEIVATPPIVTISTEELHRQVDVSRLPVMEIKDLY
jgi:hypothetical protein